MSLLVPDKSDNAHKNQLSDKIIRLLVSPKKKKKQTILLKNPFLNY